MQNTIQHTHAASYRTHSNLSITSFLTWCEKQHTNGLFWMAVSMLVQCCIMIPAIWFALSLHQKDFIFFVLPMVAIVTSLVINLAGLSTKITIPVFIACMLLDVFVLVTCLL